MACDTPAATASWPVPRWVVPLTRFCRNRSCARFSNSRSSIIFRYISSAVASVISGTWIALLSISASVGVGDVEVLGRKLGQDVDPVRPDHHLFLDPGRRPPVGRRAVGL